MIKYVIGRKEGQDIWFGYKALVAFFESYNGINSNATISFHDIGSNDIFLNVATTFSGVYKSN